jgi:hypothetical protein
VNNFEITKYVHTKHLKPRRSCLGFSDFFENLCFSQHQFKKKLTILATVLIVFGSSRNLFSQVKSENNFVGSVIRWSETIYPQLTLPIIIDQPKPRPIGSCRIFVEFNPASPQQLNITLVAMNPGLVSYSGGTLTDSHGRKQILKPRTFEIRDWPNLPTSSSIRAGVGRISALWSTPQVIEPKAGQPVMFKLMLKNDSSLGVTESPQVKISLLNTDGEIVTKPILVRPTENHLEFNPSQQSWEYQWTPLHAGRYRIEPLLLSSLVENRPQTILLNGFDVNVLPPKVFELPVPESGQLAMEQPKNGPVSKKFYFALTALLTACFAISLYLTKGYIIRTIIRKRLRQAMKREISRESALKLYRMTEPDWYRFSSFWSNRDRELMNGLSRQAFAPDSPKR